MLHVRWISIHTPMNCSLHWVFGAAADVDLMFTKNVNNYIYPDTCLLFSPDALKHANHQYLQHTVRCLLIICLLICLSFVTLNDIYVESNLSKTTTDRSLKTGSLHRQVTARRWDNSYINNIHKQLLGKWFICSLQSFFFYNFLKFWSLKLYSAP